MKKDSNDFLATEEFYFSSRGIIFSASLLDRLHSAYKRVWRSVLDAYNQLL